LLVTGGVGADDELSLVVRFRDAVDLVVVVVVVVVVADEGVTTFSEAAFFASALRFSLFIATFHPGGHESFPTNLAPLLSLHPGTRTLTLTEIMGPPGVDRDPRFEADEVFSVLIPPLLEEGAGIEVPTLGFGSGNKL
jgi:hypothetical protein